METIKIENGIPMPELKHRGKKCKYPYAQMEVGQSFVSDSMPTTMISACSSWAKRNNPKWKFRVVSENGGSRIWRIK